MELHAATPEADEPVARQHEITADTMTTFLHMMGRNAARDLAEQYYDEFEEAAFIAGKAIAKRDFSQKNLYAIFKWKTRDRGKSRIKQNTAAEVEDALGLALAAKEPRFAIAVLTGLHGIQIPVASAIMTTIKPDEYTVIDFRALEALGETTNYVSIDYCFEYLAFCGKQARKWSMTLRQFDRALWQWSKTQGQPL